MKGKINETFKIGFTKMIFERLSGEFFSFFHSKQTIFWERVLAFFDESFSNLFFNFNDVRARNYA